MTAGAAASDDQERRRRPRLMLSCPVRLFRSGNGSGIETRTENITCEGFYCITQSILSPREKLECELILTGENVPAIRETIVLRCRAEVVRVVRQPETSAFGVGIRLADYTIEKRV